MGLTPVISTERSYNQVCDHIGGNYLNDVTCRFFFSQVLRSWLFCKIRNMYTNYWGAYDRICSAPIISTVSVIPCHVGGKKQPHSMAPNVLRKSLTSTMVALEGQGPHYLPEGSRKNSLVTAHSNVMKK